MTGDKYSVGELTDEIIHTGDVNATPTITPSKHLAMLRLIEGFRKQHPEEMQVVATGNLHPKIEEELRNETTVGECAECGAPTRLGWKNDTRACVLGHRWQVGEG